MGKKLPLFVISITVLLTVFFLQYQIWGSSRIVDIEMWSNQAKYVATDDLKQFNAKKAYGHPGGPLVLGTFVAHELTDLEYNEKLFIPTMAAFSSLIIVGILIVCLLLGNNLWWALSLLGVFSINRAYFFSTPPSIISSLLITLGCLVTLYIYNKRESIKIAPILFWSFIAGLSLSTRIDIGFVTSSVFFLFLATSFGKMNWRKTLLAFLYMILFFIMFNPFMWSFPLEHLSDILHKALYHYADYSKVTLPITGIIHFSFLALLGIFIFLLNILRKSHESVLPAIYGLPLFVMTCILSGIFLTSNYQVYRYFVPLIFIWEAFLPMFLIDATRVFEGKYVYIDHRKISIQKLMIIAVAVAPVGYHLGYFIDGIV